MLYKQVYKVEAEPMTYGEAKAQGLTVFVNPAFNNNTAGYRLSSLAVPTCAPWWIEEEEFNRQYDPVEQKEYHEKTDHRTLKMEAIDLALRCPGVTAGNLVGKSWSPKDVFEKAYKRFDGSQNGIILNVAPRDGNWNFVSDSQGLGQSVGPSPRNTAVKPTIGRIVIYKTTEDDRVKMRSVSQQFGCNVQDELPAIITAVWSDDCVNLKVMADGNLELWVTSVLKGDQPLNWNWPTVARS